MERTTYNIDAKGKILGKIATDAAVHLRGKYKPTFTPHIDDGDIVVITNCKHVHLTGKKKDTKTYIHYTGYPGGIREKTFKQVQDEDPTRIVYHAVYHMLPNNKLRRNMMKRLQLQSEER